ncbi:MAG: four helix bundle protein [Chloroflexi bacterium]|nr:MAG: four helix bundle protein [Chloroflexota bacterium]MBL1196107.1 four helix bundle protein [Chloroflexota bacterium]NOH13400.1 four helix bundle protein [Chloroflexota bacterium]
MALAFEDLQVLKETEKIADAVWNQIHNWGTFERDTVEKQISRSIDSIGANIAEAFGRYHYGDKLRFLYYPRGSIYESKYWLNRTIQRNLLEDDFANGIVSQLTMIAKRLNSLAASTKSQKKTTKPIKEKQAGYQINNVLFSDEELSSLAEFP